MSPSCVSKKAGLLLFPLLSMSAITPMTLYASEPPKVCMVLDKGGKDDRSFNESAVLGFNRAIKEFPVNKTSKFVEPKNDAQISQFFRSFATSAKCDLIIAIGYNPSEYLPDLASKYPNKKFLAVDTNLEGKNTTKNIRSITFAEHDGSFLVGAIAAMKSTTGKIGFVGGMDIPLIHRFETGYSAGAKYINPKIKISTAYVGITPDAWNNPAKAKELAHAQYNEGTDVIYQVAANSGQGVFDSAEQMNKKSKTKHYAIGVDSNQNWINPKVILTSMVKRVDNAVYLAIKDFSNETFNTDHTTFNLKDGGVDWAYDEHNKKFFTDAQLTEINGIKEKIINGKIIVPDYYKLDKK
ncbi:BMP family lipoprotein [Fluviispira multicolorata]|uniref:BMP family ABC transporter substrate-binding protein n=1 Tax=Fluviispira multicolorata TaxID=2654512 RepID=A0A833JCS3_9BACT|nr:BMP family ABC transporter substrate-binding protein [Fluviispira multicolorata]KAB8030896.1 BMP family ABC transporter substrate-binding protein [Fluviispira multicolorata]